MEVAHDETATTAAAERRRADHNTRDELINDDNSRTGSVAATLFGQSRRVRVSRNVRKRLAKNRGPPSLVSSDDEKDGVSEQLFTNECFVESGSGDEGPHVDVVPGSLEAWFGDGNGVGEILRVEEDGMRRCTASGPSTRAPG